MAVIQQVYFAKEGYSIYIRAIKPDEDNPESGLIWISGNPSRLVRRERYHINIASRLVITDSYQIPLEYIHNFVVNNGCMEEKDGELYVVYKEVEFNPNLK